jgi:hypothetical protein
MGNFKKSNGLASQFLKADGSVDSTGYLYATTAMLDTGAYDLMTNINNSSGTKVGEIDLKLRMIGTVVMGVSLYGYILHSVFPGSDNFTKVSLSIPDIYMPKGPIILNMTMQQNYSNMRGQAVYMDSSTLYIYGLSGNGLNTDYINTSTQVWLNANYPVDPVTLTLS